MAQLIDGKAIAAEITEEMRLRAQALREKGIVPCLAVILAGNDPASEIYVRNKRRACKRAGIESRMIRLDQNVSREEILREIHALNQDPAVHAVLVQLPLPGHLDETEILSAVLPEKDADGFHPLNAGRLLTGEKGVLPCTPAGCMELLRRTGVSLSGAEAVVIGRSNIVGKPMSLLLLRENCTVTLCHSRTKNLAEHVRRADVVICAVGRPGLVTGEMIKPGATVIDVGINRLADGRVVGDADFESVSAVAGAITPVPGGVGPMTIAMLMKNTVRSAWYHLGR